MEAMRVWVETRWFQKFWQVRREYARHLALRNRLDRSECRKNGLPLHGRGTLKLLCELLKGDAQ